MPILGLLGTEQFKDERFKNIRREVFYHYPEGAAPLTGLLSLMSEEDTNDPEFIHYEKRLKEQSTLTISQGSSKGPLLVAAGTDAGDPISLVNGTEYQLCVASTEMFLVGHVIKAPLAAGSATIDVKGVITAIVDATHIKFRAIKAAAALDNGITNENVGKEVLAIGSAYAQGAVGAQGDIYNLPIGLTNFCQIFRKKFTMTGTALKTGAKFDETGTYKDKAKEHSVYHMVEMERAFLFGHKNNYVDGTTNLPTYTTGGLLYHMEQWEAVDSVYRGGTGAAAITVDTNDKKRIITNAGGTLNERTYDTYLERAFRVCNNRAREKLVFCGSGFLSVVNQMYRSKSVLNADLPMTETYGMNVVRHLTPFGTVYYKTHPLFSDNDTMRFNAFFIDLQNLKYRYVQGRDTELLKNRQPNNADYREDEWLSECGMECRFPESHLYLQNVRDYTP